MKALIIVAQGQSKYVDAYVIRRGMIYYFIEKHQPDLDLDLDEIIDLFIIADFKAFGKSGLLPNGRVVFGDPNKEGSNLKSWGVSLETCYYQETFVDGEFVESQWQCTSSLYTLRENVNMNGGGSARTNYFTNFDIRNNAGGGGTGGTGNDSPTPDIKNLIKYPCASSALLKFINFDSIISNLLRIVFEANSDLNIKFSSYPKLSGTDDSGEKKWNSYLRS